MFGHPAPPLALTPVSVTIVALCGIVVLAFAVGHLLRRLDVARPDRAAALVLMLPSVLLNFALLGQCDAWWAAACVMALAAALDRRHAAMLAWCGLALSLCIQAVLIAPLFIALLINRRVPFWLWPIVPAVAAATIFFGWPASGFAIWLPQTGAYPSLSLDAPNLWSIVQALPWIGALPLTGLALAAAIGATAAYIAWFSARPLNGRAVLSAALLCTLVTAGLLPRMQETSFFLADVLSLALALAMRDRLHWRIAFLVQAGSSLALFGTVSGLAEGAMLGGLAMIAATILLAKKLLLPAANDNPLMARTLGRSAL